MRRAPGGKGTPVSEHSMHSLVLASDYRVDDVERTWSLLEQRRSLLASIGAHHVVVYASIWEPGRVLVTIGLRNRQSVAEVLRSPAVFEWFDIAGVTDIPPVFAGEVLEKIDVSDSGDDNPLPGVIVAAIAPVDDVSALVANVRSGVQRFRQAGVRKVWFYQAFDDGREVMILSEVDDEDKARRWVDHPDAAAEWMSRAGFGAYPSLFVGRLAHVMSIEATR